MAFDIKDIVTVDIELTPRVKQMSARIHSDVLDFVDNQELKLFFRIMQTRCRVNFQKINGAYYTTDNLTFNSQEPVTWPSSGGWVEYDDNWVAPLYIAFRSDRGKEEVIYTILHEIGHCVNCLRWGNAMIKGSLYCEIKASQWALRVVRRYGHKWGVCYLGCKLTLTRLLSYYTMDYEKARQALDKV